MISLLLATALAGGTFHPDDIAAQSEAFARASEAAPKYEEAEADSRMLAQALTTYEENLDLLGSRAPEGARERLDTLRTTYGREQAELQSFAGALMEDFDTVFTAAMERAVAAYPDAQMCARTVRKAGLPGMPGKEEANPECQGDDLSADIAKAMDGDAQLAAQVDELLAREWPTMTSPEDAQAPIGASERWVTVDRFFGEAAGETLRAIRQADEDARLPIAAALEEGKDPASQLDAARKITEQTAAKRAALAAPFWAAIDKAVAKRVKKGNDPIAFCANPVELGGCTGENASAELTEVLLADKKVGKLVP
ncbi:MAG: hypothetical protein EP330_29315 [Deltaproteobacteria bacterium]|nr:MAG: hypothetical protein EP330_29315 [Deltaproteobacteria bacterium]